MDSELSPSSIGSAGVSGSSANRKERGAIAAQACETCRNRKQKCDELRPKCGTCQKFKLDCRYREPLPTKKDKTLVQILDRLRSVEDKVDALGSAEKSISSIYDTSASGTYPVQGAFASGSGNKEPTADVPVSQNRFAGQFGASVNVYVYVASTSSMLDWPVIRHLFDSIGGKSNVADPAVTSYAAPALLKGLPESRKALDTGGLESATFSTGSSTPASLQYAEPRAGPVSDMPVVSWDTIQALSKAYFSSFHLLHPIIDSQWFMSQPSVNVVPNRFDLSSSATLVLLVLALGEVALTSTAAPISMYHGRPSGIKGGNVNQPPGLALFNEARKRMGFFLTDGSIENVQILSLAALYYASCGRGGDCWRAAASASLACHALVTNLHHTRTPQADIIRRLYWHCSVTESFLRMEFHLPMTNSGSLDSSVGMPNFVDGINDEDYLANETSHFQEHFASQIVLSRLLTGFNAALKDSLGSTELSPASSPGLAASNADAAHRQMKVFAAQLEQWKGMLPTHLTWQDDQILDFTPDNAFGGVYQAQVLFTSNLDSQPLAYSYVSDIQAAMLRTRYYYVKYLLHRPYVYKALHHEEFLTRDDIAGAAECLKASLKWPVSMSPPCTNKRLIPLPFYWSQNLAGVLILLHLWQHHPTLSQIRPTPEGQHFDFAASETVDLCVDWLRDMRQIDVTAERCWALIQPIYGLED